MLYTSSERSFWSFKQRWRAAVLTGNKRLVCVGRKLVLGKVEHQSSHPFSIPAWSSSGLRGRWGLSQLSLGKRQGTLWTECEFLTWPHRDKLPIQFIDTNESNIHVFGQWEEAGIPRENPRMRRENMQTPHRKAPDEIWSRNPLAVRRQC